jgi:hypothetical protein
MAIVRLEELGQFKNPMTSEMEPANSRLVAYCLNQLRYRMTPTNFLERKKQNIFYVKCTFSVNHDIFDVVKQSGPYVAAA